MARGVDASLGGSEPLYSVEFGIAHEGCAVNEHSRAAPSVRSVCLGGFIVSAESAPGV